MDHTMEDHPYPTRGYHLIVPTIVETRLSGWVATVQFSRHGHRYAAILNRAGVECFRNDQPVTWERLTNVARKTIHAAVSFMKPIHSKLED